MAPFTVRIPPFNVRVRSAYPSVARHLTAFYPDYGQLAESDFIDYDLRILPGRGVRRLTARQARFFLDSHEPFLPLPANQAAPLFEWGLNWAIASRPLGYLIMHAAVLARADHAVILPGMPGAGKSTLCASLTFLANWRLLSDELAILDPERGVLLPNPRPICVKNESIEVVNTFPGATLGPAYHDTRKGTVSHIAAPRSSIEAAEQPAICRWIVFPRFAAGASPRSEEIGRAEAFALISEQSFNKERMGAIGFEALCRMLGGARCFTIEYGSTRDGLHLISQICAT